MMEDAVLGKVSKKISQKFYLLSCFLFLSLVIFYLSFCLYDNFISNKKIESDLVLGNKKIAKKLNDSLAYTRHIMKYIGDQVVRNNAKKNYQFINKLLISYRIPSDDLLSWSTFSWVDENFHLIISSNAGIDLRKFGDLSGRDYMPNTVLYPNTLQTGAPVFGVKSKLWSIPIGYGVTDNKGKYIGAIVTGIVINSLENKLRETIGDENILYAILDERSGKNIIKSAQINDLVIHKILRQISLKDDDKNFYSKFFYYEKIPNSPYSVITVYAPEKYQTWIQKRWINYFLLLLVMIIIFLIPLTIFRKKLIIPIIELSKAAEAISTDKKFDFHIKSNIREVKDLEKQLRNLEKYKADLLRAKDAQSNFFLNMSHELRTPLTGVISFAELIKNEFHGKLSDEYKIMAGHIYNSGNHLLSMISDLLKFAKINKEEIKISEEKFNVLNEINSAEEIILSEILKKNLKIEKISPNYPVHLFADKEMFCRIVLNLLSNAIKFSHENNKIEIKILVNKKGDLEIFFIDYGIGIKEEDISLVLEEYGQAYDGYKNNKNGIGLGLPIVQKILNIHGGKLEIESIYGEKTTIKVVFPANRIS